MADKDDESNEPQREMSRVRSESEALASRGLNTRLRDLSIDDSMSSGYLSSSGYSSASDATPSHSAASTMDVTDALLGDNAGAKFEPPKKRFMVTFPAWLEDKLACIDDPLISTSQKAQAKFFFILNMALTYAMALEISVAAPVALYVLGWDAVATDILYLSLTLSTLSQIPKRFLWRYRPFMVHRAQQRKKTTTSSFPSRAVACATVYAYILANVISYATEGAFTVKWWHIFLLIGLVLAISFARVNLGVHYPTDCIAGTLLGIIVCLVAIGSRAADSAGCGDCVGGGCYSSPSNPDSEIMATTLRKVNFVRFGLTVAASLIVGIGFIVPPIQFWTKFIRVYGVLLPALLFRVTFLCPAGTADGAALAAPVERPWYAWLFAILITATAMTVASVVPAKKAMISYSIFYVSLFCILSAWRLFII